MRWNNRQANNHRGWNRDVLRRLVVAAIARERAFQDAVKHQLLVYAMVGEWDEVKKCQAERAEGRMPRFPVSPGGWPVGKQWAEPSRTRRLFAQVAASVAGVWARLTRRTGRPEG